MPKPTAQADSAIVHATSLRLRARVAALHDRGDALWKLLTGSVGPDVRPWNAARTAGAPAEPNPFAIGVDSGLPGSSGGDARGDLDALRRRVLGKRERRVDPAVQAAAAAAGKKRKLVVADEESEEEGRSQMVGKRKGMVGVRRKRELVVKKAEESESEFDGFDDGDKTSSVTILGEKKVKMAQGAGRTPKSLSTKGTLPRNQHLDEATSDEDSNVAAAAAVSRPAQSQTTSTLDETERARLKKQRKKEAKKRRKLAAKSKGP